MEEKLRALKGQSARQKKAINEDPAPFIARIRGDLVKEAAYTLLNRLVYLRLLEAAGLREVAVLTGGWLSWPRDFRDLVCRLALFAGFCPTIKAGFRGGDARRAWGLEVQ